MEPPRVNPIGILETPPDMVSSPRRSSRRLRLLAGLLLALFFLGTVVTTVVSFVFSPESKSLATTSTVAVRFVPAAKPPIGWETIGWAVLGSIAFTVAAAATSATCAFSNDSRLASSSRWVLDT